MGRKEATAVAKTIKQAVLGQDLKAAWIANGKPGTWGNVQRRAKAAVKAASAHGFPPQQHRLAQTYPTLAQTRIAG